ncbi:pilus assembly protein PilW [Pseudomonas daroniae]|uniref:Pilus assembly protein PilW n=1 Tax=Phytopseudomonas daroniae TaxID=2487519 RepID=A0A4Q9QQ97_9GAMM|nr:MULTISPECIES: PilW family protein [Pseudomonas]TBU81098.1 pilus assembly protein PilW [Pseudomonas daroniae]TBU83623.1 pilus assembly protein PilW [Pseudomonas sp. FRB 228]TBU86754.1 pilus assembly protein PilW [Pseudomonas daroniae]
MNRITRQAGLSLVELMIALAISSFLILGITQVYIDNQRHYLFQQSQSGNLDSGRFAALIFDQYLGKAGYRRTPSNLLEMTFPEQTASGGCLAFSAGASVTGLDPAEGTGFCVRYQPQVSGELDCQGVASSTVYTKAFPDVAASSLIVLALKYEEGASGELQNGRLLCKSLNVATPQFTEQLTGIADMRLDFGIGSTDVLSKEVTSYVPQKDWTTSAGAIRSVRYSLLLASRTGQRDSDDSKVLTDWLALAPATTKTRLQSGDNKRIYQVVGNTQTVRNLMP